MKDEELKVEALRQATALHCSPVATGKVDNSKPADVLDTAKKIYEWLKQSEAAG